LPAGKLDLRLGQDGYVPTYYWDTDVAAGSRQSLAPAHLKRGASVVGFVVEQDGVRPASGCEVEVTTTDGRDIFTQPSRAGRSPEGLNATTNGRGFFQIAAAAADGEYQLNVTTQDRGSVTLPIRLVKDRELRISSTPRARRALGHRGQRALTDMLQRPWRIDGGPPDSARPAPSRLADSSDTPA
jgi:hypothetical protein